MGRGQDTQTRNDLTHGRRRQDQHIRFRSCGAERSRSGKLATVLLRLTLWQVESPDQAVEFNRRANVGLHHLAVAVVDRTGLDALYQRASNWPGVIVEFSPQLSGAGPKIHFMVREPSGVRIEFTFDPRLEGQRKVR